ncbi:GerAB/ArcD/ProY family transporter [[Brevibacterium] frigoritolerans]|uniref:GerAB/ArcD/ProY family transporter n=1 Tax=Peribacillus frigoritolerans TaxID=450367 RepID=A0A941FQE7_9BACI|nr:GerAB/ArcD/ProY family transporter [Peribacillus frigoritolerans]
MLGFEMILMYYPFIKNAERSQKYAHGGVVLTTLLSLLLYFVSIVFYSQKQLTLTLWPTLTLTSIIELPLIQRFEYITVSWWTIIIIPIWSFLYGLPAGGQALIQCPAKVSLMGNVHNHTTCEYTFYDIDSLYILNKIINPYIVCFIVIYLPLLFVFISIKNRGTGYEKV